MLDRLDYKLAQWARAFVAVVVEIEVEIAAVTADVAVVGLGHDQQPVRGR